MWLIIFIPIRDIHHRDENKKRLYIVTHTQSERSTEQQSSTFTYILTSGSGKKISLDYVIQKIVWKNSHATTWLHQLCIARFTAHVLNLWTVWIIQRLAHPRRQCQMLNKAREDTCLVICYYPSFVTHRPRLSADNWQTTRVLVTCLSCLTALGCWLPSWL